MKIIKRMRTTVEHHSNPLHVLCRFIDVLLYYDKIWRRCFCRTTKKEGLTHEDAVRIAILRMKKKRLQKKFTRKGRG